jgi:hypothetical protein
MSNTVRLTYVVSSIIVGALLTQNTARADTEYSNALFVKVQRYNGSDGKVKAGSVCRILDYDRMPAGRTGIPCTVSEISNPVTGFYSFSVTNAAPFPEFFDAGHTVFVSAVGSNAHCTESRFSVAADGTTINAAVTCVDNAGNRVNSEFTYLYRADSFSYPLLDFYRRKFAYGRFNRGAPTQLVSSDSFTSYDAGGGSISNQRLAAGQYRVTFQNVSLANSDSVVDPATGLNNVIAQRTCADDSSTDCRRAECTVASWSFGATTTTVNVNCYVGTTPVDVDFRVFVGAESHDSQELDGRDLQFAWENVGSFSANNCRSDFMHRSMKNAIAPNMSIPVCRNGTGIFRVDMGQHVTFYHSDALTGLAVSRTAGNYCTLHRVNCGGSSLCTGAPAPYVEVRCYNSSGTLVNTPFNLSVLY